MLICQNPLKNNRVIQCWNTEGLDGAPCTKSWKWKTVAFLNSSHASNFFRSILSTLIFSNLDSRHDCFDNTSPHSGERLPLLHQGAQLHERLFIIEVHVKTSVLMGVYSVFKNFCIFRNNRDIDQKVRRSYGSKINIFSYLNRWISGNYCSKALRFL